MRRCCARAHVRLIPHPCPRVPHSRWQVRADVPTRQEVRWEDHAHAHAAHRQRRHRRLPSHLRGDQEERRHRRVQDRGNHASPFVQVNVSPDTHHLFRHVSFAERPFSASSIALARLLSFDSRPLPSPSTPLLSCHLIHGISCMASPNGGAGACLLPRHCPRGQRATLHRESQDDLSTRLQRGRRRMRGEPRHGAQPTAAPLCPRRPSPPSPRSPPTRSLLAPSPTAHLPSTSAL